MSNPAPSHWQATKRVLIYCKSTASHGLRITGTKHQPILDETISKTLPNNFELFAYSDSDWACAHDRSSITGFVIFMNGTPIIWKSGRQPCIALSTTEAELIAASACCQELVWISRIYDQLNDRKEFKNQPISLCMDNMGALALCDDTKKTSRRTKHIEIKHFFVRDLTNSEKIRPIHVASEFNASDILTKPLARPLFVAHKATLNIRPPIE